MGGGNIANGGGGHWFRFGLGGFHAAAVAPDGLTFAVAGDDGLAVFDCEG